MTRIDRYLLREALPPFLFGLVLYAGLAVVSATLPRLQWIVGTPFGDLAFWLLALLPQALVQTAPVALVLAVLLAFGRLATDHELTAVQAGGVPIARVATVFVLLGVATGATALAFNEWVVPRANAVVADVYWRLTSGRTGLFRLAAQRLPVEGFTLRFESVDRAGVLSDVRIERWDGDVYTLVRAATGRFDGLDLVLTDHRTQRFDLGALDDAPSADAAAVLRSLVRLDARGTGTAAPLVVSTGVDEAELVARFSAGGFEDPRSISRLRADASDTQASAGDRRKAAVLLHRKLAEPVSNVVLLLVSVPLSIAFARSRAVAFGLALAVTLAWYLLYTFGQLLSLSGV
ncbi:MAG: LptF/LptG family permease, partial [Trueperaceae bacterium]|nr:LptF/LptG family permease [Trueperaceae bacterium]